MDTFEPKLWQLFRYLSNPERMNVFRTVSLSPESEGMNVLTVTRLVRLGEPATSTYLRQLASCGLLCSRRDRRFLFYTVQRESRADGAHIIAQELANWFCQTARTSRYWGPDCPPLPFGEVLPGLSNRLRVVLLRGLAENGSMTSAAASLSTQIPEACCRYHLQRLVKNGLAEARSEDTFVYSEPQAELSRLFVRLSTHH